MFLITKCGHSLLSRQINHLGVKQNDMLSIYYKHKNCNYTLTATRT